MNRTAPESLLPLLRRRRTHCIESLQAEFKAGAVSGREKAKYLSCQGGRVELLIAEKDLAGVLLHPVLLKAPRVHDCCLGLLPFRNRFIDAFSVSKLLGWDGQEPSGHLILCALKGRVVAFDAGTPGAFQEHRIDEFKDVCLPEWPAALNKQLNPGTFLLEPARFLTHPAFTPYQLSSS